MKKLIRKLIIKSEILFQFYYRYIFRPRANSIQNFLNNISKSQEIYFVQIGANDGIYNDPLYKYIRRDKWKGVLIEPQKKIFNRLRNNYKNVEGIFFLNAAIDCKSGARPLYKISFTDADWASGLSSFIREKLEDNINSGYVHRKAKES